MSFNIILKRMEQLDQRQKQCQAKYADYKPTDIFLTTSMKFKQDTQAKTGPHHTYRKSFTSNDTIQKKPRRPMSSLDRPLVQYELKAMQPEQAKYSMSMSTSIHSQVKLYRKTSSLKSVCDADRGTQSIADFFSNYKNIMANYEPVSNIVIPMDFNRPLTKTRKANIVQSQVKKISRDGCPRVTAPNIGFLCGIRQLVLNKEENDENVDSSSKMVRTVLFSSDAMYRKIHKNNSMEDVEMASKIFKAAEVICRQSANRIFWAVSRSGSHVVFNGFLASDNYPPDEDKENSETLRLILFLLLLDPSKKLAECQCDLQRIMVNNQNNSKITLIINKLLGCLGAKTFKIHRGRTSRTVIVSDLAKKYFKHC